MLYSINYGPNYVHKKPVILEGPELNIERLWDTFQEANDGAIPKPEHRAKRKENEWYKAREERIKALCESYGIKYSPWTSDPETDCFIQLLINVHGFRRPGIRTLTIGE